MDKNEKNRNKGWIRKIDSISLEEVNNSVKIPPANASFLRKLLAFMGPGALVAVGYVDPGNWATSIEGGSEFGYTLLSVILIASLIATLMQEMAARLGIATSMDLAQATSASVGKKLSFFLWILTEVAIIATDIAEVIGSAIALKLLFNIPILLGVTITTLDVLLLLLLQKRSFRIIESVVIILMATIFIIFAYEILLSNPNVTDLVQGYIPSSDIVTNPSILFVGLGILGATVMPHNLYLHSSIIQTRSYERTEKGKKEAVNFARIDSIFSLTIAFLINSMILILGASAFYGNGQVVSGIEDAYALLAPTIGASIASTLFAIALLASGQNSTITGTLSGQIVMEGFIHLRVKPWVRRIITRLLAVIPVFIVTIIAGENGTTNLLIFSQVILSMQLPFALVPLVLFTSDKHKMGSFVNSTWVKLVAWTATVIIICLNVYLVVYTLIGL
ncbi:Nramp family divalent metal transporter [Carnobacterium viridans]|uniref:Divalent metal cation transporter MntH n=1 Tax=Carnobacterium viridans TaxID=174587 RepID=A0A1H0ZNZ5_9LACT|nr:Nramp family divalent metal transporter [Carnobacterium viridans]UDE94543.1 Nramp family divalent metal transporter [Carnobacterium viridans]SDQ28901.1 manganese transport protein [Carnobacterium viridans]